MTQKSVRELTLYERCGFEIKVFVGDRFDMETELSAGKKFSEIRSSAIEFAQHESYRTIDNLSLFARNLKNRKTKIGDDTPVLEIVKALDSKYINEGDRKVVLEFYEEDSQMGKKIKTLEDDVENCGEISRRLEALEIELEAEKKKTSEQKLLVEKLTRVKKRLDIENKKLKKKNKKLVEDNKKFLSSNEKLEWELKEVSNNHSRVSKVHDDQIRDVIVEKDGVVKKWKKALGRISKLKQEREKMRNEMSSMRGTFKKKLDEQESAGEEKVKEREVALESKIKLLKDRHVAALQKLKEEHSKKLSESMSEVEKKHKTEISGVKKKYKTRIGELEKDLGERGKRIEGLVKDNGDINMEYGKKLGVKERKIDKLRVKLMKEMRVMTDNVNRQMLEVKRRREELKKRSEKAGKLEREVEQEKKRILEEREAEVGKMEKLESELESERQMRSKAETEANRLRKVVEELEITQEKLSSEVQKMGDSITEYDGVKRETKKVLLELNVLQNVLKHPASKKWKRV